MRILVLGGTRFIGRATVRQLLDEGHELTLFHRGQTAHDLPGGVRELRGDRRRLQESADALRAVGADAVVDMIPITEEDARQLVAVFRGAAGRLIVVSSQDVYRAYGRFHGTETGPPDPAPVGEAGPLRERLYPYRGDTPRADDDPRRILDDYDKILVERVARDEPRLAATVLRLPMVYGPRDGQHRLFNYLKRMDDRRPAIIMEAGWAAMRRSRGYVDNVAAAIALATVDERAAGRVYNVGDAGSATEREWVEAIAATTGWGGRIVAVPRDELPESLRVEGCPEHHLVCDSARIRDELRYREAVDRETALERTVEWERRHPPPAADPSDFNYDEEDRLLSGLRARSG